MVVDSVDRGFLPKDRGVASEPALKLLELLFPEREGVGREPLLRIVEQERLPGIGGWKGIHKQDYAMALPEGEGDKVTRELMTFLHAKLDRHRPKISWRDGKPKMVSVELTENSDMEYMRVILPYDSRHAGSVADYRRQSPTQHDSWVFVDVPLTGTRKIDFRDMTMHEFLTTICGSRGTLSTKLELEVRAMEDWDQFEVDGRGAPLIVLRGKQAGRDDPLEWEQKIAEMTESDPRIGVAVTVTGVDEPDQQLSLRQYNLSMGHTSVDAAPIKTEFEQMWRDCASRHVLQGDQLVNAQALLDQRLPLPPAGSQVIPLDLRGKSRELQVATMQGAGARELCELFEIVEIRTTDTLPDHMFDFARIVNQQLAGGDNLWGRKLKIPISLYLVLAMRAVAGGAVVLPVADEHENRRMQLAATPGNMGRALVELMQHIETRLALFNSPGRDAESKELRGRYSQEFVTNMQAVGGVIVPFVEELTRARAGQGSVTGTVERLGSLRKVIENVVGVQLTPEVVEVINASKMLSTLGLLEVPDGIVARGSFTTAGSASVDEALGLMGDGMSYRWFMNDSLGLFFVTSILLKRQVPQFGEYLVKQNRGRYAGAIALWGEYGEALNKSPMLTGTLVPREMISTYEKVMNSKRERLRYQRNADQFLQIFAKWLKEKDTQVGRTLSGTADAAEIRRLFVPTLEAAAEYKLSSIMYGMGCYMVAVQMASERDGYAQWEEKARAGDMSREIGSTDLHYGNLILDELRKSWLDKHVRFNRITSGMRKSTD